jgi:hypothetical protein
MKNQPNLIQRLKAAVFPTVVPMNQLMGINSGITLYPHGKDQTFIQQGYKKNWAVYVVVRKCVRIFSQVPWYHYKINTKERKTYFDEYMPLTKTMVHDRKAQIEMKKMLKKSVDQVAVTSDLSKLLKQPNRNQTGGRFRGNLMGHKMLTGEGNQWFARPKDAQGNPDMNQKPSEIFVIPKANLAMVKGNDPWSIDNYKLIISGAQIPQPKNNVIMWIEDGYEFDPITLKHLRGQAPLDAWLLGMQAMNEGSETLARMNKNQGVSGFAWNKADTRQFNAEQALFNRKQFNSLINDSELAGTIAYFTGEWGYNQIGLDARALQLLEQQDKSLDVVCMLYDVPIGAFKHGTTYENKPQEIKDLIYNAIAPSAFELREEWNKSLIPQFGLDSERDVIDCDILALPQLTNDIKTMVETLSKAWQLTPNQVLEYLGYDRSTDANMDKVYIPANLVPLDQANSDLGANLDAQMNALQ